ncbi:hypothetical protein [Amycolatopsis acididurans]|uniref:hypothetical protein n=1 Tax=Amycolatopsis acididurans TaxID=2724524 RepID=UPI001B33717F|nr:hypothetical protein [Amycolatopsis acididurans]
MVNDARWRLSARGRKQVLLAHILSTAVWFGVDVAMGVLVVLAMVTSDPATAGIALRAAGWFAVWPMFGASLVCLATGILLGLGTRYGLLRYWWVAIKLAATVVMSVLLVTALRVSLAEAARDPAAPPASLLGPVAVAPTLLITAFVLSVFKPAARLRRSRSTKDSVPPGPAAGAASSIPR